jgi:hypothetical protein
MGKVKNKKAKVKTFEPDTQTRQDGQTYINLLNETISKNADNFDKLIITLSSSFLALSIAFIDKVVPLDTAIYKMLLISAWILFICSIILTLVSFIISELECNKRKNLAGEFYFQGIGQSGKELRSFMSVTRIFNYFTAGLYILGTVLITVFVSTNIYCKGEHSMANQRQGHQQENREDSVQFSRKHIYTETRGDSAEFAAPPPPPVDDTIINRSDAEKE